MPDLVLPVNTALTNVPVNIFPLIDDTDFKTIETGQAYNATGMSLKWNFVTTAGVRSQTSVTPTTSGVYDWAHLGGGMYGIEIPASGGASINNDTEGFGFFSGIITGVLPWRGPTIQFQSSLMEPARKKFFNVSSPTGTVNSLPDAVPNTASGLPIKSALMVITDILSDSTAFAGASIATIVARIGAFTGTGLNTILGFLRALANKAAALTPSDLSSGGTFDNTLHSQEAIAGRVIKVKKATAIAVFRFTLRLASDGITPATGLAATLSCKVGKDTGAFAAIAAGVNSATEIGSTGSYYVALSSADMNFDSGELEFAVATAVTLRIPILTQA